MLGLDGLFYVSQCDRCGLLFQNPSLKQELLAKHYPDEYAPYSLGEMQVGRTALWYLKNYKGYAHLPEQAPVNWLRRRWGKWTSGTQLLPDYVPNGSLLEIACASGNRLSLLRKLGWANCTGVEYSERAARLARERGFTVYAGRVEDVLDVIPAASQDVVIASFVLEHLQDPFVVTEQIASKLRAGGQFLFSTLDVDSLDFALYREFWYNLDLPRHFTFLRKRDLRGMLSKSFRIEGIYYRASTTDYVGSARYRLKYQSRLLDRWIIIMGGKLGPACLLMALIGKATRICIHARKN